MKRDFPTSPEAMSLADCLEILIVLNALEGHKLLNRDKLKACIEFLAWLHPEVVR